MTGRRWILFVAVFCATFLRCGAAEYGTEDEWLIGRVIEDIRRMAQFGISKKVEWHSKAKYRVFSSSNGCTIQIGLNDITLSHPWDTDGYAKYVKQVHPGVRLQLSSPPTGLPYRLLDLRAEVLATESVRVSQRLTASLMDPQAHEEAALIQGCLALRESSGRFYDPRVSLCRMTAHLAFAKALRDGGDRSFSGQLAEAILYAKGGFPAEALKLMDKIKVADDDRGLTEWKSAMRLTCTGDWRGKGAVKTLVERFAYTRAVLASSSGQASKALVDAVYAEPPLTSELCDWHRIFLEDPATRRYMLPRLPLLLKYETNELIASSKHVLQGGRLDSGLVEALNERPGYCVGPDNVGLPTIHVIDWGCLAAFTQRHLAHMFTFVPGQELIDRTYHGLRLYPLVLLQHRRISLGLDRVVLKQAAQLCTESPECVNDVNWLHLENLMEHATSPEFSSMAPIASNQYAASRWRKPPLLGYAPKCDDIAYSLPQSSRWFSGAVLQRTSYRSFIRRALLSPDVPDTHIAEVRKLDPWDPDLAIIALSKVGDEYPLLECDKLVGDLAKYNLAVMRTVRKLVRYRHDDYVALLDRTAAISPDAYLAKALYLQRRGDLVKAEAAFVEAQKAGVSPSILAHYSGWLIDYLSSGKQTKKLEQALVYAGRYGGYEGLMEQERFLERQNRLADAEKTCLALQRKYAYHCPLLGFYVRYSRKTGKPAGLANVPTILKEIQLSPAFKNARREYAMKKAQDILFPGGKDRYQLTSDVPGVKIGSSTPQAQRIGLVAGSRIVALNGYSVNDVYQYYALRSEILVAKAKLTWIVEGRAITKEVVLPFLDRNVKLAIQKRTPDTLAARIKAAAGVGGRITRLNLSRLGLTTFPPELFQPQFADLEELNISNNSIPSLPSGMADFRKLKRLYASNCGLTDLPSDIGRLATLETIDLSNNLLEQLPSEIGGLKQLQELDLKDNQLKSLPVEIAGLERLRILRLTGNALTAIPVSFGRLSALEKLSLGRNQLKDIPAAICQLVAIQDLLLFENRLLKIPPEFGKLTTLQRVDLRFNFLTDIPKEIDRLKKLKRLQLGGNRFDRFPKNCLRLHQLLTLDLGGNFLTELPVEISQLNRLQTLIIAGNYLESLPESLKILSASLTEVALGNNAFTENYLTAFRKEMKSTKFREIPYEK